MKAQFFTEMKSKHKVLLIIGGVILVAAAAKSIQYAIKRKTAIKSFGDENIATAKRLYAALYPEGKPDAKFSIWNPFSVGDVVGDLFKADADIDDLMKIAGNELNADNFKKVARAYDKLYKSILLEDLQDRMGRDYKAFDDKVKYYSEELSQDPEERNRIIRTLSELMYDDLDAWPRFTVDDKLYNQLDRMSDKDFIDTYYEFQNVLNENSEKGTLRTWLDDDRRTMDAYVSIIDRMNRLGLK